MKAAKDKNVELVIFPGKYLDRDLTNRKEIMYEYQYNTLFSFAREENLDAHQKALRYVGLDYRF